MVLAGAIALLLIAGLVIGTLAAVSIALTMGRTG